MQHHANLTGIVPEQFTGKEIVAEASARLADTAMAKAFYQTAKARLLAVNDWHGLAGVVSAGFQVVDAENTEAQRPVTEGDYLRIDIPGPGSAAGGGYDWARVEVLNEVTGDGTESIGFRVRPTPAPGSSHAESPDHFYTADGTSTFTITRNGDMVTAAIIDRNIEANTAGDTLGDRLRHTVVGAAAVGFFSKIQWNGLAKGLVANAPEH